MVKTCSECTGFAAAFSLSSPLQKVFIQLPAEVISECCGTVAKFSAGQLCKAASTLGN